MKRRDTFTLATEMVELERLAKQEYMDGACGTYWKSESWKIREHVSEMRSAQMRAQWASERLGGYLYQKAG